MAHPEGWLKTAIEGAANLNAYPLVVPEGQEPPYVVYFRSQTARERTLDNYTGTPEASFPVSVYSDGYMQGKQIADSIREACHAFQGAYEGTVIEECSLVSESDGEPEFMDGRDKPTYVVEQEYFIRWKE